MPISSLLHIVITSVTFISSVVRVPVLSRQSTSTLARVSMQYISCTSTFFRVNRIIETASTELVSKIIPLGIIPSKAATVLTTVACKSPSLIPNCLIKKAMPTGKRIKVHIFIIKLKERKISELTFFMYFASSLIFAA